MIQLYIDVYLGLTDSTITPPPKPAISFTTVSWLLDTSKHAREKNSSMHFLFCKGRSNDDVGVARRTAFQALRPGAGFKTGDFIQEKMGGLS